MEIKTLTYAGDLIANTHLLYLDEHDVIAFDLGQTSETFVEYLKKHDLHLLAVFLTHGHFDHIQGLDYINDDVPIYISDIDYPLLTDEYKNCSIEFQKIIHIKHEVIPLSDQEEIKIHAANIKIIFTPFHTAGSAVYLVNEKFLVTGDTLFKGVIGRSDLPTSTPRKEEDSLRRIKKIYEQYGDMPVFPGHGENTTLKREVEKNFYLRNINN